MRTIGLIVVLAIAAMLMVSVACNGPNLSERPESDVIPADPALSPTTTSAGTAVPEPSLTTPSIDGATWILESLDGQPPHCRNVCNANDRRAAVRRVRRLQLLSAVGMSLEA